MDLNLWEGGRPLTVNDCGDCRIQACPGPHRMSAHRRRSPYLMGGAFDPACDVNRRECYETLVDGDIVWLALIPEDAFFQKLRLRIDVADATAPIIFNVIANRMNLETCVVGAVVALPAAFAALTTAALVAVQGIPTTPAQQYTDPYAVGGREGIIVGLELTTLPPGGALAFMGRINLAVYAEDFEVATLADCRLNGPCIINNP